MWVLWGDENSALFTCLLMWEGTVKELRNKVFVQMDRTKYFIQLYTLYVVRCLW